MITLTLPYPLSGNRYWRSFIPKGQVRPVVTLSKEAHEYKQQVGWLCKAAGIRTPFQGRVKVHVALYPQRPQDWKTRQNKFGASWDDDVRCIDVDNANKVLLDSLKGIAFGDDAWVWSLHSDRMEPDGEARVVVTITLIHVEQPQASLLEVA